LNYSPSNHLSKLRFFGGFTNSGRKFYKFGAFRQKFKTL